MIQESPETTIGKGENIADVGVRRHEPWEENMGITGYERTIQDNLAEAFARPVSELERSTGGSWDGGRLVFRAFGRDCCANPEGIALNGTQRTDPIGVLVSLYLKHAQPDRLVMEPLKSFKEFPGSMPYHGPFSANSERVLIPHVGRIQEKVGEITAAFAGSNSGTGDFSLILYPLPKIALCYVCYLPDEELPGNVTVLFSANALSFMPLDGLADVAEYTSKEIIRLVRG